MADVIRLRAVGFAELQILILAGLDARHRAFAVKHFSPTAHDRRIECSDRIYRPDRHVDFDIGNAERDASEARGVRLVAAHAIAPWTDRLDMIVALAESKCRAFQLLRD